MRKNRLLLVVFIACVLALTFCLASCGGGIDSLTLDKETATVQKGSAVTVNATVEADEGFIPTLTWTTSNASVVTVAASPDGLICEITAVTVGTATVTVSYEEKISASVDITVVESDSELLAAAKAIKTTALTTLLAGYTQTDYSETNWTKMNNWVDTEKAIVGAFATTAQVEAYTTTALKARLDEVATIAQQLTIDKAAKVAELDALLAAYAEEDYSATNWTALGAIITTAKTEVAACTTSAAVAAILVADVKADCDEIIDLAHTYYTVTIAVNNPEYATVATPTFSVLYGVEITLDNTGYGLSIGQYSTRINITSLIGYTTKIESWTNVPEKDEEGNIIARVFVTGDMTITATLVRTADTYELTFDANGGTGVTSENEKVDVVYDTKYGELPTVTREGYTFDGWYASGVKIKAGDDVKIGGDTTAQARWIANKYNVTFDYNGAGGFTQGRVVTYDGLYGEMPAAPTRSGFTFLGWYAGDTLIKEDTKVKITEDTAIVAQWNKYIIFFDSNGGTCDMVSKTVTVGEAYGTLPTAQREGFAFLGWYLNGETKIEATTNAVLYHDSQVIAMWDEIFDITYNNVEDATNTNVTTYTALSETIELVAPVKFGHSFDGWYSDETLTTAVTKIEKGSTGDKVFYAKWTKNSYTLTFNLNNGASDNATPKVVTYDSTYGTLPTATRPGYTFTGWRVGSDIVTADSIVKITQNTTATAQWTPSTFTLSFNKNGGVGDADPMSVTFATVYEKLPELKRDGYIFIGWFVGNTKIIEGATVAITANSTAEARWANTFKVSFNLNDGDEAGTPPNAITVTYESTYGTLPTPTRVGYTFNGWYIGAKAIIATTKVEITADTELTAKWTALKVKLTFDVNGGTGTAEMKEVTYGAKYGTLPTLTKENFDFAGWQIGTGENATIITKDDIVKITADATAVAQWIASYSITYKLDGGTNASTNPATYNASTETITLADATKTGYVFDGWFGAADQKITTIEKGSTGNITLTAKWHAAVLEVTFNLDGGTGDAESLFVTYGGKYGTLPVVTKAGYTFNGWAIGTTDITSESDVAITANSTAKAKWTANEYTLSFNLNYENAPTAPVDKKVVYNEKYGTLPAPERTGYKFLGWIVGNTLIVKDSTIKITENATAVAQWTKIYNITYNGTTGASANSNPVTYTEFDDTIVLTILTKEGYSFQGWYNAENKLVTQIEKGSKGDLVLTATWKGTEFVVLFDGANGQTFTKRVAAGTAYGTLPVVTKVGYTFDGWYLGNDNIEATTVADIESNVTIVAKWIANEYELTFNLNGGTGTATAMDVTYDAQYGTLPTVTKEGFAFDGWFIGETEITATTKVEITDDAVATARWIDLYTITYNLNGGTNAATNPADYTIKTATITLAAATKAADDGCTYAFAGWYSDAGFTTKVTTIEKGSTGNKELFAKFTETLKTFTITYTLNGGVNAATNPVNYTIETATITLAAATKAADDGCTYAFAGWYSDAGFTTKVTTIEKGSFGNKELFAKFDATKKTFTITYVLDGGVNAATNPADYTIETDTITLAAATKAADNGRTYAFAGWYSDAGFTTKVTTIEKGSFGNKTLIAKFEATLKTFTITYNLNGGTNAATNPADYTIETATITLAPATKAEDDGRTYAFAGWYDNAGFTGDAITKIEKGSFGNKELFAKFTETLKTRTITYTLNGGVNAATNPADYTIETATITLAAATKATDDNYIYTFAGWYDNDGFTGDAITKIEKGSFGNKTLYAKFDKVENPNQVKIGTDYYLTIQDAIANVGTGETITLIKDIVPTTVAKTADGTIYVNSVTKSYDFIIELNGFNLGYVIAVNGDLSTADRATALTNTVKLQVKNSVVAKKSVVGTNAYDKLYYGISMYIGTGSQVVLSNVAFVGYYGGMSTNGGTYAANVFASNCEFRASMTVGGAVGAVNDNIGAYLAAQYVYTFTDCRFDGDTAILIKAGQLLMSGCTLVATGNHVQPSYNGNGGNVTGDALVLQPTSGAYNNNNQSTPIVVNIKDATAISSAKAYGIQIQKMARVGEVCNYGVSLSIENTVTFDCELGNIEEVGNVSVAVNTIVNYLSANVYNKPVGTDLNDPETANYVADANYYVLVKENVGAITSIKVGDNTYQAADTFKLSAGNSNFVERKAFMIKDNDLYVAAILLNANSVNGVVEVRDIASEVSYVLTIANAASNVLNYVATANGGNSTWDLATTTMTVSARNQTLCFYITDANGNSVINADTVLITAKYYTYADGSTAVTYGLTKADFVDGKYQLMLYVTGWDATDADYNADIPMDYETKYVVIIPSVGTIVIEFTMDCTQYTVD